MDFERCREHTIITEQHKGIDRAQVSNSRTAIAGAKERPRNAAAAAFVLHSSSLNDSEGIEPPQMCNLKLNTVKDEPTTFYNTVKDEPTTFYNAVKRRVMKKD